jgi:hypothetical protein
VPDSGTCSGLLAKSSVAICSVAERAPSPCGANATVSWQLSPGATDPRQPSEATMKSPGSAPPNDSPDTDSARCPASASVSVTG